MPTSGDIKKTVLIVGISSFVGSSLAEFLKKSYRVIGSYYDNPVDIEDVLTFYLDITSDKEVKSMINFFQPDLVIYCVGLTSLIDCDKDNIKANSLNAAGLFGLTRCTERHYLRLIYLSSSYVFSGEKRKFNNNDIAVSNTFYGKSKSLAEFFIKDNCLNYIILRCCNFYGRSLLSDRPNWFEEVQNKFFKEENIELDSRIKGGFLDISYLAQAIQKCIDREINKISLNLSSQDVMSKYEFIMEYAKIFNESKNLIGQNIEHFPEIKTVLKEDDHCRELEYHMNIEDTEKILGIDMPSIEQSLCYTKNYWGGN